MSFEVTVTSLLPPHLCRFAVFSVKPTFSLISTSLSYGHFSSPMYNPRLCRIAVFSVKPTLLSKRYENPFLSWCIIILVQMVKLSNPEETCETSMHVSGHTHDECVHEA